MTRVITAAGFAELYDDALTLLAEGLGESMLDLHSRIVERVQARQFRAEPEE